MKKRIRIYLAMGMVLLVGLFFWNREYFPALNEKPIRKVEAGNDSLPGIPEANRVKAKKNVRVLKGSSNIISDTSQEGREDKQKRALEEKNVPIRFWGRVVDQDGNPLQGVKIKTNIRHWVYSASSLSKSLESVQQTGVDGNFQVLEGTGDVLSIDGMEKEGYELSPKTKKNFGYNISENIAPDSGNPVLFRMWKKGVAENLIGIDKDTRIPYDGTPVAFDLLKGGTQVGNDASGDIRIALLRTPLHFGPRQKFDWIATVEVLDGGLIEFADEFMYRAPETGYAPKLEIKMVASDVNWSPRKKVAFYVKCRGGQFYGRIALEFRTGSNQPTTGLTITSAINPNGSRNLQP